MGLLTAPGSLYDTCVLLARDTNLFSKKTKEQGKRNPYFNILGKLLYFVLQEAEASLRFYRGCKDGNNKEFQHELESLQELVKLDQGGSDSQISFKDLSKYAFDSASAQHRFLFSFYSLARATRLTK